MLCLGTTALIAGGRLLKNENDWLALRTEFPTLTRLNYLNTCSLGLLSKASREGVQTFLDLWEEYGASAWYSDWLEEIDALRHEFAKLINCKKIETAIQPSISVGVASLISGLDFTNRNQIITTDMDFPTVAYQLLAQQRSGVEILILRSEDKIAIKLEQFREAINEKTALVATSRVFFNSGYVQNVEEIGRICRSEGVLLLLDDYQGCGQLPIDVSKTMVDILLTGGLKWLLGGPGISYMYVNKDIVDRLNPVVTGWFAHKHQFKFDPYEMVFKDDARRLENGTPSISAVYSAKAGIELVNKIGVEAIYQRTNRLTLALVSALIDADFSLRIPDVSSEHASITCIRSANPVELVSELKKSGIVTDARPGGLRISPYFYNNDADISNFVEALVKIRELAPQYFSAV